MMVDDKSVGRGAHNLLVGCAGARAGETLLILHEDPSLGFFGNGLVDAVAHHARKLGLTVEQRLVPFSEQIQALPPELEAHIQTADHTLFLARLGDQLRFQNMPPGSKPIVSYALDLEALASDFGSAPHAAFAEIKNAINALFATADKIRVTCPNGTEFTGRCTNAGLEEPADVTIKRYPLSVFAPLDAGGFEGRVAVNHLLVGTGSRYYEPYGIPLQSCLFAYIEGGRILGWEGFPSEVARAEAHYAHVANLFGIDGDIVHSWHAGIHPGCAYTEPAHAHYERWSGSAFGNPRLLHFHTCGAYAPGEICWNVVDPTILVDGIKIWDEGRIRVDAIPGAARILKKFPQVRRLFDNPSPHIGLARVA